MIVFLLYLGKQQKPREKFAKTFFFEIAWFFAKNWRLFFFLFFFFLRSSWKMLGELFFFEHTCTLLALDLGLENSCPWSQKGLSSRSWVLGLGLGRGFLLFLTSKVVSSAPLLLSVDLHVWKDETKISQPLRSHIAFSPNCFYRACLVRVFSH